MLPQVQYARADDTAIACWSLGSGRPLLILSSPPFSHLEFEWEQPEFRFWYEELAKHWRVIRYDAHGTGLSSRQVSDVSVEALSRDIDAVADHYRLEKFNLFGQLLATPVALNYAAQHADRVSSLILAHPTVGIYDRRRSSKLEAMLRLLETDWGLFVETVAHARRGWNAHAPARQLAELIERSVDQDLLRRLVQAFDAFDVQPLLGRIQAPTLVLYARGRTDEDERTQVLDVPTDLTSRIAGASLALVPGDAAPPYAGDAAAVLQAVKAFLLQCEPARADEPLDADIVSVTGEPLSPRELDVLRQIALGRSNQEIAAAMTISLATVKTHASSIYRKLGVRGRLQAAGRLRQQEILE